MLLNDVREHFNGLLEIPHADIGVADVHLHIDIARVLLEDLPELTQAAGRVPGFGEHISITVAQGSIARIEINGAGVG